MSERKDSCKPCRESNAKCDKKRPRCGECLSKGKQCGGYDMGRIFINVNSSSPPPIWSRSQNAQKYLVLDLKSQSHDPENLGASLSRPSSGLSFHSTSAFSMATLEPALPDVPPSKRDPTNIPGIVDTFLDLYYRRFNREEAPAEILTSGQETGGWRILLPYWIGRSPTLDMAIGALAASFIGAQCQDPGLVDQGRNMYLQALQMVQQALSQPESATRKDLLVTTLAMSSIELFLSNGASSSQAAHIDGATRLLDNTIQSEDVDEIHLYVLNQGLFQAISMRQRYPFSDPAYRHLVHRLHCIPRTSQNGLFFQWCEIVLPLPNILHTVDSILSSTGSSQAPKTAVLAILEDIKALEHAMIPWYEQLKANNPGAWTFPTAQTGAASVPFPLQFVSIETCTLYCLHWSSQLLILEARQMLNPHLPPSELPNQPTSSALVPQIAEYASLICRSFQYCTENKSFAATENMFFPLYTVANFYRRQSDGKRMKWCAAAFNRIAAEQRIGYASGQFNLE
ncbi:hypothetical protein DM02DRAFT_670985 [Periconia macrospinosa]|uniref:Zn(2)-C6 fungal-type domain-containing protein n=1 Tax=Periconia macrospinosa TaxID=97972 RepID=A0A2V1DV80_9PLEO|nr:hypothetical protein DM02DRAFT_670985 [Periconia macrospinosa]